MRAGIFKIKKAVTKICLSAALLLTAVTISSIVSPAMTAYAAEDGEVTISDTVNATISEGGKKLTITGTGEVPQLSSMITGYSTIETVVIEEGITSLAMNAFKGWSSIKNVSLPDSLNELGAYAFRSCTSLIEITIPKGVETFGTTVFKDSKIQVITFAEGVQSIPINSFKGLTTLSTVNLPDSLTTIGSGAFENCTALTEITIPKNVTSANGAFESSGIQTITFADGMIKIPDYICSELSNLTTVNFPDSVTTIGNDVFKNCTSLSNIVLPDNLTTIGYYVFEGCTSLKELTIPSSVTTASGDISYSLGKSSIETITFEDGMKKIPNNICANVSTLITVNIPNSVTEIGSDAFSNCILLTNIELPNRLEKLGNYAFDGCTSLSSIELPQSITSIGTAAFGGTAITEITIPKNVTKASVIFGGGSNGWGENNTLTKIVFENGIETIPASICDNCTALTEITIPDSVTSIPSSAFLADVETPTTVNTNNSYVKGLDWATTYNRPVTFMSLDEENTPGGGTQTNGNTQGLTMTGTVSPITTVDITIPLDSLSFSIDSDRNLTAQTTQVINNSQCPLDMYILSIEAIGDAPNVIARDTYTEKEWNNLSAFNTLNTIAISLNDKELYEVFNNTERDKDLAILIGRLKSGFAGAQSLELTPDAQYGKSFFNKDDLVIQYKVVFEVVIP